jgi:hypothetical protein
LRFKPGNKTNKSDVKVMGEHPAHRVYSDGKNNRREQLSIKVPPENMQK